MDGHIESRVNGAAFQGWNTLEEFREIALAQGCTLAQFKYAEETIGSDPHKVAAYLQRRAFIKPSTPAESR